MFIAIDIKIIILFFYFLFLCTVVNKMNHVIYFNNFNKYFSVYCNGEDKGMKIHLDKRVLISKDKVPFTFVVDRFLLDFYGY